MRGSVKDRDNGYRSLLANVGAASGGAGVKVGIQGAEATAPKRGDDAGDLDLVTVAAIHEFGLGVPERSWLRAWVDENRTMIEADLRKAAQLVIGGKARLDVTLERVGLKFQAAIQERIVAGIAPALAPETIARKGSSTPLVDTGQLKSAITYIVVRSVSGLAGQRAA
jgi:hypothetical protein